MKKLTVGLLALLVLIAVNSQATGGQTFNRIEAIAWNATGELIATVEYYGEVIVTDAATRETVFKLEAPESVSISQPSGYGTNIAWHPHDPDQLAVSTREQGVSIYDVATGLVLPPFESTMYTYTAQFSSDGQYILTSHGTPWDGSFARGAITVTEIATRDTPVVFEEVSGVVVSALWQPGGTLIAGLNVGEVGEVVLWDSATGKVVARLSEAQEFTTDIGTLLVGTIYNIAWTDGRELTTSNTSQINFWDVDTHSIIKESDDVPLIRDIEWRSEGQVLAVAPDGGQAFKIIDSASGQVIETISTSVEVNTVSWNPRKSQVAVAGRSEDVLFEIVDVNLFTPTPTSEDD